MKNLLIRTEDKNVWERRTPLTPQDLKALIQGDHFRAYVQRSHNRVFDDAEYASAGAILCDNLENGEVIFGIKEIPPEKILPGKIYVFFSHTIKGQKYNMPMLKRIIEGHSTLVDYERITDEKGVRQVFFGNFAGDVGAINILWLMGEFWHHHGLSTPFIKCKQALHYKNLEEARQHLETIGAEIKKEGLPAELTPLVIGILGYGNVSKGAQSIFDCLPVERIPAEQLMDFVPPEKNKTNTIYVTVFEEKHLVRSKNGRAFDLQEYYKHPDRYESQFEKYLPYLSIIVNATYWDNRYPRFVTWDHLQKLYTEYKPPKLAGIADITCDVNGSIECNVKTTDSGMPAYLCHPQTRTVTDGHKGDGIVLLAVDNLPAELPYDASIFFSNQLKKYVLGILQADYSAPFGQSGLHPDVQKAVIVYNGQLTDNYKYLEQFLV